MRHRKHLFSALALVMMAALLLSPALSTAAAASPAAQDAPQAAPEAPNVANTNRDEFSSVSYSNNNGTQTWAAAWTETGDDAAAGSGTIQITGGELRFGGTAATGDSVSRPVNAAMASALYATLSFEYRTSGSLAYTDELAVEISEDGGTSYTTLEIFHENNTGSRIYTINEFISATTRIRFRINANLTGSGDYYYLDNVTVNYDTAAQKTYQDAGWEGGILGDNNNRTGQTCSEPSVHYFTVHDRFTVTDLNVGINATHINRGEVRVTVNSPENTTSVIVATSSDTNGNYDMLVDDASVNPIDDGGDDSVDELYYDRTVGPSTNGLLDTFNGENAEGVWKVVVCDTSTTGGTRDGMSNHVTLFFAGTNLPAEPPPTGETSGPVVYTFYTPFPEDQVKLMQDTVYVHDGMSVPAACASTNNTSQTFNTNPKNPVITRNGIALLYDDTVIYYDHYEDGYEADLATRNQQSTEHWGDGDMTNGVAPLANGAFDADDILERGQVVVTADVVQTHFLGTYLEYDARDKVGATSPVAMTHIMWAAGASTLFAGALEMYPTNRWGLNYELPVGDDDNISDMFEYTGVSVMASKDGTTVNIDADDNGSTDTTCNLNEGESCQVNGGMNAGATINADEPIQVVMVTADECAFFESRMFALIPREQWDNSYFVPVGTKQAGSGNIADDVPTYAHIYNPNPFSIEVDWETQGPTAQAQFTVAAGDRVNQTIPYGSGAHFFSLSGSAQGNVRDEFSTQAYTNNDGSDPWAAAWVETGDDGLATSGDIWVNTTFDVLEFRNSPDANDSIHRSVNLSAATSATFSYDWAETAGSSSNDTMVVEVREGGAGAWTVLQTIQGDDGSGSSSYDITTFTTNPTEIRFRLDDALESGETYTFDDVDITFTEPGSGGDPPDFNVVFTVDSDIASGTDPDRNDTSDWGDSAIPESLMTALLLSSIGNGYDPEYVGSSLNNSSPLYVTAWDSANPELTTDVCFDYNADGGAFTDSGTGYEYDERFTITDLDSFVAYDNSDGDNDPDTNDLDQSGMFVFVCNGTSGIITANWGQDPDRAFPGRPAIDVGTGIPNLVPFTIGKDATLAVDLNGNGLYDPGDTIEYEITVTNVGATTIPASTLVTTDDVPDGTTYAAGTTEYEQPNTTVTGIADGPGSTLPLSVLNGGFTYPHVLNVGESFFIRFQVTLNVPFPDDLDEITNVAFVSNGVFSLKTEAVVPVQEPILSAIGNYVWFDEDGDGDQDAGEAGIPNVRVDLYQDADNNGSYETLVATTYTDANGGYLFPGLDAGQYRVDVVSTTLPDPDGGGPGGLHQTYDENNGTGPFTTPHSTTVSLGSGVEHMTADFGYNWAPAGDTNNPPLNALGAIGDRVWIDTDGDGVQDTGEAGIPGVTVELWYDSDGDGDIDTLMSSTTTNAAGNYIFDQLPQGIYEVRIPSPPSGYTQTGDPDNFGAPCGTACDNKTTTPIVLGPGDVFLNADFGYQPSAAQNNSIGDMVWFDADADGNGPVGAPGGTDTNEYGIPGVTVALISDTNSNGIWDAGEPIIATDVTDANGNYLFTGLPDGSYLTWVNDTEHVLGEVMPTYDSNGGAAPTNSSAPTSVHSNTQLGISSVLNLGVGNSSPVTNLDQDFGYTAIGQNTTAPGAIGDTVFLDADNDGVFDQGEGLEGVVVALYDNNGNKLAVTTTDENGRYYFGNLPVSAAGVTYVVQVQTGTLPNNGVGLTNHVDPDGGGNSTSTVTLTTGAPINLLQDFGYRPTSNPGSIGNFIWEDSNADGNFDSGETGIAGVTVDLYEDSNGNGILDGGDHLVGQTTTNSGGNYTFTQLPPGNYLVDVSDDAGVLNGYWHSQGTPGADNNSQTDPHLVNLAAGQNYVAADFGYYVEPAAVGNRIWMDADRDGVQDAGEAGINGVEVRMTVTYPNGNVTVLTTVTANDPVSGAPGWYSFGNLLQDEDYNGAGTYGAEPTYTVSVDTTQPALAGLMASPTGQGTPTTDSNNPAGTPTAPVQGQTNTLFSNDAQAIASYDFGFMPDLGSIGNYIWVDENSDGYQDAGEAGLPNVTVNLYNAAGALVATTVTDAQGGYLFDNLPAGTYYVDVAQATLPAGMTQTPYNLPGADFGNQDHSTTTIPTTALTGYPVTLAAGGENLTADFGYNYNPTPDVNGNTGTAALGDRVWIDADGDGVQDPEEAGIPGVTVQLFTAGPDGVFGTGDDVAGPTDVTDAGGNYLFDGLTPGAYVVKVTTPPAGYTQTGDPDHFGTSGGVNDNQTTTPVLLGPGDVFLNADFGYQPPAAQNNSIGNKVWFDADADGVGPAGNGAAPGNDNNEPGIPGVTVALIRDLDGDGTWDAGEPIIATDTTDANGDYLFPGLPDGNYLVWVNDTDNVLGDKRPTYDSNSGAAYAGSGAPTGVASSTVLGLSAAALDPTSSNGSPVNNLAQDFGYTDPAQTPVTGLIGDRVWMDIDNDGVQDANEPGLEGVMVTLLDANGNELAATFTDENGNYSFGGLPAGTYSVQVSPPAGLNQTYDADGLGSPHTSTVTIGGSNPLINLDQDFGYRGTGTVGNLVWEDLNADGNVDSGENGIGGVTLDLYWDQNGNGRIDPGEPLMGSTVTAPDGSYLFSGLPTNDGGGNAQFVVDVTDEAGKLGGYWHSLGTPGANDNSQVDPYPVTLTPGAPNNLTADFGYYVKPASVGNFVWLDDKTGSNPTDNNGIQDPGEPGIDGIRVTLTIFYPDGSTHTLVTITGDDPSTPTVEHGWYSFGNLLLDEDYATSTTGSPSPTQPVYRISVPTGGGYVQTTANVGVNDMIDSDNHAGVDALATQGSTNVNQNTGAPGSETNPTAGYDFGYLQTPLAVILADFAAGAQTDHVLVTWETVSEIDNAGFNLYRSATDAAPAELLANVPSSAPGSAQGAFYSYQDFTAPVGQVSYYWLEAVDFNGSVTLNGPVSALLQSPTAVTLSNVEADSGGSNLLWLAAVAVGLALVAAYGLRRRMAR